MAAKSLNRSPPRARRLRLSRRDSRTGVAAPHEEDNLNAPPRAVRHRLQEERTSITHKFNVGGHEGYITVGLYPNGDPGELFITMAKEGSTVSGLMDSFAWPSRSRCNTACR